MKRAGLVNTRDQLARGAARARFAALAALAGVVLLRASAAASDESRAADAPDAEAPEARDDAAAPLPEVPAPAVTLAGPLAVTLAADGEATTTWKYGRGAGDKPVDESTTHLRVSGRARSADGLAVGFSAAVLTPALHAGTYVAAGHSRANAIDAVASAWARRGAAPGLEPEVLWEAAASRAGATAPELAITVTSMAEVAHTVERRAGVTTEVTRWVVHGTVEASLACTRSATALRAFCGPETLSGSF